MDKGKEQAELEEDILWAKTTFQNLKNFGLKDRFTLEELVSIIELIRNRPIEFQPVRTGACICGQSHFDKESGKYIAKYDYELEGQSLLGNQFHELGHILNGDADKAAPVFQTVDQKPEITIDARLERRIQLLTEIWKGGWIPKREVACNEAFREWLELN